jgi:hypothetical protein
MQSWEPGPCENNIGEIVLIQNAYPNPASRTYILQFIQAGNYSLEVFSTEGKMVESLSVPGVQLIEVDVNDYAPGLYQIRVYNEKSESAVIRMIVQ